MSTKADLQKTLGVIAGLVGSNDPDDTAMTLKQIKKLQQQIETFEEASGTVITTENPWDFTIHPGTCFGGRYVVQKRTNPTKHIYRCSQELFHDLIGPIEVEVIVKCTLLAKDMDFKEIARITAEEKNALQVIGIDAGTCPYSVGIVDAGELTTPEGMVVLYWQAFKKMECDTNKLQVMMNKEIPPFIIMRIARQMAEVLVHYHARKIVHRDIKPHNILCTWPKHESLRELWQLLINFALTDAQLAIENDRAIIPSPTNMVMGTLQYMSPEQIRNARSVTVNSDMWSLGVTLYELATGGDFPHPPITSIKELPTILRERPRLFSDHPNAINYPPFFQKLMDGMLDMDQTRRPSSFELLRALLMQDARMSLAFDQGPMLLPDRVPVTPP